MMSNLLDNRYRVTNVLGSGGFGETYLAEDTKMPSNRRCVIKQLKPIADNPQMYELLQQRFHREAAVLETLGEQSRYIPKLYANFTENGLFYLVQEWIDGLTLTQDVERNGVWKEPQVRNLLISVLQTLIYVHDRGIIHRDIKPDNIILRDGEPVLIDFGAVKETLNVSTIRSSAQPAHSIVIGTPGFMASEQAAGRPFFASDLYSLALTAIFALTGQYPQQLGNDPQTGEVLWQQPTQGISADLKAVFAKVLQFDPRDRYSSAREMLTILQGNSPTVVRPESAKPAPNRMSNMQTVAVTPRGYAPIPVTTPNTNAIGQPVANPPDPPIYTYKSPQKSRTKLVGQMIVTVIVGGSIGAAIALGIVVSQSGGINGLWNRLFPAPKQAEKKPFYFLADSAFADKANAETRVQKLKAEGLTEAGLFWIPDYPNLGNSQFFQVYARSFADLGNCTNDLAGYTKRVGDAYCAFAGLNVNDPVNRVTAEPPATPTPKPTPTATPTPTPTPVKPNPEQAIRGYYNLINSGELETAWQQLTPKFQSDRALGYKSFTDWWKSVDQVSVNGMRVVEIKDDSAIIDVDLTYTKKKKIFPETLRVNLSWNESTKQWQINETNNQ